MRAMDQRFLTIPELAELLKVSPSFIYEKYRGWPHIKISKTVRFSEQQVDEIVELLTVRPTQPEMKARPTWIGTERQRARNRAYNLAHGLREGPLP